MEFAVFMMALSTSAPVFPFERLQARIPRDDFGVFPLEQSTLSSCFSVDSVTLINLLKFRAFCFYGIICSAHGYTFSEVILVVTRWRRGALRFVLDGLCAICELRHSRF